MTTGIVTGFDTGFARCLPGEWVPTLVQPAAARVRS